jgi:adenylate cyclase
VTSAGDWGTVEIERQFLCGSVSAEALKASDRSHRIRQGYLTEDGPSIRVRLLDDTFLMTVKSGLGLVRHEVEWEIPSDVGAQLFGLAGDRTISKTRYVLGPWEVDLFSGRFEGLVIAECELESPDEPLPPFPRGIPIVREVTDDRRYTNRQLALLDDLQARALIDALAAGRLP